MYILHFCTLASCVVGCRFSDVCTAAFRGRFPNCGAKLLLFFRGKLSAGKRFQKMCILQCGRDKNTGFALIFSPFWHIWRPMTPIFPPRKMRGYFHTYLCPQKKF